LSRCIDETSLADLDDAHKASDLDGDQFRDCGDELTEDDCTPIDPLGE